MASAAEVHREGAVYIFRGTAAPRRLAWYLLAERYFVSRARRRGPPLDGRGVACVVSAPEQDFDAWLEVPQARPVITVRYTGGFGVRWRDRVDGACETGGEF